MNMEKLLEQLSSLEHDQWVTWSKAVSPEVSQPRQERWKKLWCPYDELSEPSKEQDRVWARKVLKIIKDFLDDEELK